MNKKISLAIVLLISLITKAQDNWLSNNISSDPYADLSAAHSFGGKIYLVTGSYNYLKLYSSPGDTAGFTEVTSFNNAISPSGVNGINAIASDNNNMYFGTYGGSYAPQVYKFDGDTLTLDTIPFDTVSTHPNRVLASNNPSIGALTIFNGNVYSFVSPGYSYQDTLVASVWSHPVSGGSWTNTTNFSKGSGIQGINDAVVYQGRIYISVNRLDSTDNDSYYYYRSSILSSTDGANWDTVAEMLPYLTSIGQFEEYGPTYNHFEVHNDTLLVSIDSPYGVPPILYTTDASANTWHSYIANYSSYDAMYYGVFDFQSYLGKLWIKAGNDGPTIIYRYEGDTLKASSSSISISNSYGNGSTKLMTGLSNTLYLINNSGGGLKLNQNATKRGASLSFIYRLTPPVANFVDSASSGFCSGAWVDFYNTSTNAGYNKWYVNDTLVTSTYNETTYVYTYTPSSISSISGGDTTELQNANFELVFNAVGTYQVKLYAYSTSDPSSLVDSITKTLTINQSPIIDSVRTDIGGSSLGFTVCQGQPVTFTTYPLNQTNCEYKWTYMNYNTSVIEDSTSTNPGTTSTFTYVSGSQGPPEYYNSMQIVNTVNGCHTSWPSAIDIWVNQSDNLIGSVFAPNGSLAIKGQIYLFKQKPNHVGVADSTDMVSLTASPAGYFSFANAFYGDYYIQASLDTTYTPYTNAINTYYTNPHKANAYQWDSATVISHYGCTGVNDSISILVDSLQSTPGTATISGHIYKDPTYGMRLVHGGNNSVMGAPLKGVGVSLGKSPGGGCAARTTTGSTGTDSSYYEFTNVDTGSYQIFVDIPNYGMVAVREVNITGSDSSINNDYHVDSTKIYIDSTAATGIFTQSKVNSTGVKLYPNPAGSMAFIDFYNNQDAPVAASLYDISGNLISTLANEKMSQGTQSIKINLADMKLDAGVYIIRANLNNSIQNFKLTVIQH